MEPIPPNAPPPRDKEMHLYMFLDSNHAGDKQTRRYKSRIMMYMNMPLINWFSKNQFSIETSVFGIALWPWKLVRTYCMPSDLSKEWWVSQYLGPCIFYGDNMLIIDNDSNPDSTLKKRCNARSYDAICRSVKWENNWEDTYGQEIIKPTCLQRWSLGKKEASCITYNMILIIRNPNNYQEQYLRLASLLNKWFYDINEYMFEGTGQLWPGISFVSRLSELDTSRRKGIHACIEWQLTMRHTKGSTYGSIWHQTFALCKCMTRRIILVACCVMGWWELIHDNTLLPQF